MWSWLRMGGGCLCERARRLVGCGCGMVPAGSAAACAWCRVASGLGAAGLGAGVGGVGWVAAGVRVADPADLVFRFVRPPHAASQASQDDFAAGDMSSAVRTRRIGC